MNDFDDYLDDEDLIEVPQDTPKQTETVVVSEAPKEDEQEPEETIDIGDSQLFVIRTTANREDQVFDFLESNIKQKKLPVYSVFRAHGMRGYVFVEAADEGTVQQAAFGVPYARGLLRRPVDFTEVDMMLDTGKKDYNIQKNDIVEIIAGPFKRENAKITRIDKQKEEVVVELLEAAVSIPITLKFDAIKVIRREDGEDEE